jgi:transcriptional regulator with XRE-family HTH domain
MFDKGSTERQETVTRFRERLAELVTRSGLSQSAWAEKVGLDRSTLSQLLSPANDRLPRADNIVAIARAEQISIDWLLGLTQEGRSGADILKQSVQIERDARSPADERLERWHDEAMGYKIRYVPATLPDLLKIEQVIEFEYRESAAFTPEQSLATSQKKLAYLRRPETEMEVCSSRQSLEMFARAEGRWRGLGARARRTQLERMIELTHEMYPGFRWFLFDARRWYSAPVIIFGPKRAVLYVGQMYLVFNTLEHVRVFTGHFDDLVRAAVVQPTEMAETLKKLLAHVEA